MFVRYLVDAVDLFSRVDHKPTSGAGLHGERLSSPPPKKSENDNVKGRQAGRWFTVQQGTRGDS